MSEQNKVTFGLNNVHIYPETEKGVYGTAIKIPGAVSFTPSADGSQTVFHADDIAYHVVNSNNGYTADLTMALIPNAVLVELLGWIIDENEALIEIADAKTKSFALAFQVSGDVKNRKMIYYSCVAGRPAKEEKTNADSIDIVPEILSLKISPVEVDGKKIVKSTIEESTANKLVYDAWFTTATLPSFA